MLYIEARKVATGSNMFDALAQYDDPTPAESMNVRKPRETFAYTVWNNPRKSRNTSKQRSPNPPIGQLSLNRSRNNSKRRSPNVSERQKSPEINDPKRTKNDGPESGRCTPEEQTLRFYYVRDEQSKKQINRKKLQEQKTEIETLLIQNKNLKKQAVDAIIETQKEIADISRKHNTGQMSKEEYNKKWKKLNDILKDQKEAKTGIEKDMIELENKELEIEIKLTEDD